MVQPKRTVRVRVVVELDLAEATVLARAAVGLALLKQSDRVVADQPEDPVEPSRRASWKGSAMGNLVLFAELRQRLDDHLELVSRVAAEGDAKSALSVMRREVPGLVAAFHALVDEHMPDENGCCRKCRSGPFWRRVPAPCRMLIKVHLAVGASKATTRDRTCWSPRRHRLRESTTD